MVEIKDLKYEKAMRNEGLKPEDILEKAVVQQDMISSLVLITELSDGTVAIRYSEQKNSDLVWMARALQLFVDDMIKMSME